MEALISLVVRALNHLIEGESWAQTRLAAHSGAQLQVDAGVFVVRLAINDQGLFQPGEKVLQPDVSITLPGDLAARLLFERDTLFSSVKLGGSADIAESLAFVLRNLRWDGEADLAQLVGDIPARRLSKLGMTLAAAIHDATSRMAGNFTEYAIEESGMLAASRDVTAFGSGVVSLRDDVARLEKRIDRL